MVSGSVPAYNRRALIMLQSQRTPNLVKPARARLLVDMGRVMPFTGITRQLGTPPSGSPSWSRSPRSSTGHLGSIYPKLPTWTTPRLLQMEGNPRSAPRSSTRARTTATTSQAQQSTVPTYGHRVQSAYKLGHRSCTAQLLRANFLQSSTFFFIRP